MMMKMMIMMTMVMMMMGRLMLEIGEAAVLNMLMMRIWWS